MIFSRADQAKIESAAAAGMHTMFDAALIGDITIEEVARSIRAAEA